MTATSAPLDRVVEPILPDRPPRDGAAADPTLAIRLAEAGHEPVRQAETGWVIALGNRGLHHATVRCEADRTHLEVSVATGKPLSASSSEALARFLALGASAFNGLTGTVQGQDGRQSAVLKTVLAHDADVPAIREAIEGLGLACDHLGPAARALAAEPVARRYLTHLTPNEGAA